MPVFSSCLFPAACSRKWRPGIRAYLPVLVYGLSGKSISFQNQSASRAQTESPRAAPEKHCSRCGSNNTSPGKVILRPRVTNWAQHRLDGGARNDPFPIGIWRGEEETAKRTQANKEPRGSGATGVFSIRGPYRSLLSGAAALDAYTPRLDGHPVNYAVVCEQYNL